jgi:hypothetical protein
MSRTKLCIAVVLLGFGFWLEASDIAAAQSNSTIAAEQSCVNAAKQNNNAAAVSACTQALSLAPNNATVALILCAAQTAAANYGPSSNSNGQVPPRYALSPKDETDQFPTVSTWLRARNKLTQSCTAARSVSGRIAKLAAS